MAERDQAQALAEAVQRASADGQPVIVCGTGSKSFLAGAPAETTARLLSTCEHRGVVEYRPDELVVTARAGTPIRDLVRQLARENQMLSFEPPSFAGLGTLGGAVAAGLAGPARPWRGSVRDAILGVRMINGGGEILSFGGRVVKNVAGYDVSRLQAGAFGTLGVLLDVHLKVLPRPPAEQTRVLELDAVDALTTMRSWARRPWPLSGLCHVDGRLHVRLEGAEPAVARVAGEIGGEAGSATFWERLNNHELDFFRAAGPIWRSVPAPATAVPDGWEGIIDWGGGCRWRRAELRRPGERGFDTGFARSLCLEPAGGPAAAALQQRLKAAFDPDNLLNPDLFRADVAA